MLCYDYDYDYYYYYYYYQLHCVPKSDAKIQINITTAHLIRINPLIIIIMWLVQRRTLPFL